MGAAARAGVLVAAATVAATLSGLAAFAVAMAPAPSGGGVPGTTLLRAFLDPFVLSLWLMWVGEGALAGSGLALLLLWRVDLERAVPRVILATVAGSALAACVALPMARHAGLACGGLAMVWARRRATRDPAWRAPVAHDPTDGAGHPPQAGGAKLPPPGGGPP